MSLLREPNRKVHATFSSRILRKSNPGQNHVSAIRGRSPSPYGRIRSYRISYQKKIGNIERQDVNSGSIVQSHALNWWGRAV
jgi:hypothetical protein